MESSLPKKCIEEFKQLAKDDFGLELSDSEAEREAYRVLELFWLVLTDGEPDNLMKWWTRAGCPARGEDWHKSNFSRFAAAYFRAKNASWVRLATKVGQILPLPTCG